MESKEYWREREEKWQKQQIKDDKKRQKEINKRLQYAKDQLQKEINSQWENFSKGEKITISEARKRANKMDVEAFARTAKKYVEERNFSKEANRQLKLYNLTMRVNRLELLRSTVGLVLVDSFDDLQEYVTNELKTAARLELLRQAGILGLSVPDLPIDKMIKQVLDSSFRVADFPTFSESLWQYQAELKADLDKLLVKTITQGKNPKEVAKELDKLLTVEGRENAKFNVQRLMITETTRVQTGIQELTYERAGIDEYEYIAEPSACDKCLELDGQIFKVSDMQPGENAPNMHPFCRCSTVAYMDREKLEAGLKERGL